MDGPAWLMVNAADVPLSDDWLSGRERQVLAQHRLPHRHADWRLGRWAAKQAILATRDEPDGVCLDELEILAAADGSPKAWFRGTPAAITVSISHRDGSAVALVCRADTLAGCDVELIEPRAPVFVTDWFTPTEREAVERAPAPSRDLLVTMIWSAKESALKAIRQGLRLDTRDIEVELSDEEGEGWRRFAACWSGKPLAGWSRQEGRWVVTTVIDRANRPPLSVDKFGHTKERFR